jgi:hypothetical protein
VELAGVGGEEGLGRGAVGHPAAGEQRGQPGRVAQPGEDGGGGGGGGGVPGGGGFEEGGQRPFPSSNTPRRRNFL